MLFHHQNTYYQSTEQKMIGFMRNARIPMKVARLLAKTSKYNGIDLVYINPSDVDMERKIINGRILEENKWVYREVPIPPFIDISTYSFKYKEVVNFLRENSVLSNEKIGSKTQVSRKIKDEGSFANLIIPSLTYTGFDKLEQFLIKHQQIVMKPQNGLRGNNIYMLTLEEDGYLLSYNKNEEKISRDALQAFTENVLTKRKYVLQKYIASKTANGDPFDCRIRLEKNGKGKWAVPIYLIRIGTNQKVVSNVAQGGSVTTMRPFLEDNFEKNAEALEDAIKNIGRKLPYKVEKIFNTSLVSLGIDIGIDRNTGELYLFEIETGPGFEFGMGEIALAKSEYYKYILNNLDDITSDT
ncbi:YheC/YheD family protein [Virgibacillus ainsalahensis]